MPPGQALAPSPEVEAGRRLVAEPVMMEFEEEDGIEHTHYLVAVWVVGVDVAL